MAEERVSAKEAAKRATRVALLEAATSLLFESPSADPIGALRPIDVVRHAKPPRSNGAFYNIWPTKADFRRDLLHYALSADRAEIGEETTQAAGEMFSAENFSLVETFRILANLNFEGLRADPGLRLKQALWSRQSTDSEVRELLAGLYADVTAMLVPMYTAILRRSGRQMSPPYTVEHLASALTSLAEGLYMRWAVQPTALPNDLGPPPAAASAQGEEWTFFASTAFTLFLGLTQPVEE